jgi:hypothetical protein
VTIWTAGKTFGTATAGANGKFTFDLNTTGLSAGRWTIVATRQRTVSLIVEISIPH